MADDERSQAASPRRLQEARAQGHVAHSGEFSAAVTVLAAVALFWWGGAVWFEAMQSVVSEQLQQPPWLRADVTTVTTWGGQVLSHLVRLVGPLLIVLLLAAVLANVVQTGWLFLPARIALDMRRIDPQRGAARIVSAANLLQWVVGCGKMLAVAAGTGWYVTHQVPPLVTLAHAPPDQIVGGLLLLVGKAVLLATCLWWCVAVLDYAMRRWELTRRLQMTPQEARQELQAIQHNPQVLARRRNLWRRCTVPPQAPHSEA